MAEPLSITIGDADAGSRLDAALARHLEGLSRTRIKALILSGAVSTGGATISEPRYAVKPGETILVNVPNVEPALPRAQPITLDILFEDNSIIVINKPAGLVVHPGAGHRDGTLVNALIAHCGSSLSGIGGVARPGIVHRLDKDTSGVITVAKTDAAHQSLSRQFADHGRQGALDRRYRAYVWGAPAPAGGTIDAPLGRSPTNPQKFAVRADGKFALTHYRVQNRFLSSAEKTMIAAVECRLETGRTHQIRVHMAHIGHPIVGDSVYGAGFQTKTNQLPDAAAHAVISLRRQALHAAVLAFEHPKTAELLRFEAPLPADLAMLERALRS